MTFTRKTSLLSVSLLAALLLLGLAPQGAGAAVSQSASLGGGNSLLRAGTGATNANFASSILSRLSFASTRGGQSANVPPEDSEDSNSGEQSAGGETGTNGDAGAQDVGSPSPASGGGNNGGAQAGNGGNGADGGAGGSASTGGLVRAGDVVSNANAVNMINVNIIRITTR